MSPVSDVWIHAVVVLGFVAHPGLWVVVWLSSLTALFLVTFRRQIGGLLDRTVYLRLPGIEIVAHPGGSARSSPEVTPDPALDRSPDPTPDEAAPDAAGWCPCCEESVHIKK